MVPRAATEPGPIPAPSAGAGVELLPAPRRFAGRHLAVVAAVLVMALAGTWWWFGSAKATTIPVVSAASVSSGPSANPSPAASASAAASSSPRPGVFVHVLGAVAHPGVVELPAGARVKAAITAAGGLAADADPAQLNLAEPVEDGCQIVIGTKTHPLGEVRRPGGSTGQAPGTAPSAQGKVNLNTADQARLEQLPGVGPATAQTILTWRAKHGSFTRIEELQEVDGIGPKTYAKLAPLVEV